MDYESMMQWFEGREPYKLECIQRQAQYHSTYVGEYTFFFMNVTHHDITEIL